VYGSELCFFPRPGDGGFCDEQLEESSNVRD